LRRPPIRGPGPRCAHFGKDDSATNGSGEWLGTGYSGGATSPAAELDAMAETAEPAVAAPLNRRWPSEYGLCCETPEVSASCFGAFAPRSVAIDHRKGQQAPRLISVLGLLRQCPQLRRVVVLPQPNRCCHGKPLSFATVNQISTDLGISLMSLTHREVVQREPCIPPGIANKTIMHST
jgi:hypothetical protein